MFVFAGRKVNQHIGGGTKFDYFMIDFHRRGPKEPDATYDERVTLKKYVLHFCRNLQLCLLTIVFPVF